MDQAHQDRKVYLENKGNLDENEKSELEALKEHEAQTAVKPAKEEKKVTAAHSASEAKRVESLENAKK